MSYSNTEVTGDLEKLQKALQQVTASFGSVDSMLEAFGLAHMPSAQRYGILFGFLVFITTISAVLALLVLGGSFKRIAEQTVTGKPTLLTSTEVRKERPLLLETLLEGRERLQTNYSAPTLTDQATNLTQMLLNVAPDAVEDDNDNDDRSTKQHQGRNEKKSSHKERHVPPYYEENYSSAYRKCQDQPGGKCVAVTEKQQRNLLRANIDSHRLLFYNSYYLSHFQERYFRDVRKLVSRPTPGDLLAADRTRVWTIDGRMLVSTSPFVVLITMQMTSTRNCLISVHLILSVALFDSKPCRRIVI